MQATSANREAARQWVADGRFEEALGLYAQLAAAEPTNSDIFYEWGLACLRANRSAEALGHFLKTVKLNPANVQAYIHIGMITYQSGDLEAAKLRFQQAAHAHPTNPFVPFMLGNICKELNQPGEAAGHFQSSLKINPEQPDVLFSLGHLLQTTGQVAAAISLYEQTLALQPNHAVALNNMGNLLKQQGRLEDAAKTYERAIAVKPDYAAPYFNLGLLRHGSRQFDEALNLFEKAIQHNPQFAVAYRSLGDTYLDKSDPANAAEAYQKSLSLAPSDAIRIKHASVLPRIIQGLEEIDTWRAHYLSHIQALQSEALHVPNPQLDIGAVTFFLAYHGLPNKQHQQETAKLFKQIRPWRTVEKPHRQGEKVRIGFVSPFLNPTHTIGKVFLGIIEHLSRERFDVTLFTYSSKATLPGILKHQLTVVPLPVQDMDAACDVIAGQSLDILFYTDIGMDPMTYFLAYNRLAPLQCVSWGHPDTTGIDTLDCYISSSLFETPSSQADYTEQLLQMQTIPAYYHRPRLDGASLAKSDFGFSEADHLYLCPQTLYKFHPDFDAILRNILLADPQGILVLANANFPDWSRALMRRMARNIPDVYPRIRMLENMPYERYLHLLNVADVMVDTLYFGGGSTTYEALSLGTPVVTQPTQFLRGRMAAGLYQKMGIPDCIAQTAEEYVSLAVKLATDQDYRRAISERIQAASHVLFEDMAAVRELEDMLLAELLKRQTHL